MQDTVRIAELSAYSLLNILPYISLAIYPFHDNMRFSKKVTALLITLLSAVQVAIGLLAGMYIPSYAGLLSICGSLIYMLFYFAVIKVSVGKTLFTMLLLSNVANLVVVTSKCIEGMIFPTLAVQGYRWSFSVIMIAVQVLFLVPLFFYFKKIYVPSVKVSMFSKSWRYLWLIPATFYLLWYYNLYCNASLTSLQIALRPSNALFLFAINIGALLIYYVVSIMLNESAKNLELNAMNHQLQIRSVMYGNIKSRIAETRKFRHDLHHHIIVMSGFIDSENYTGLKEYFKSYQLSVTENDISSFCENNTLNIILMYFSQLAKQNGIDFSADVRIDSEIKIPDEDLTVLTGNLLENAVEACSKVTHGQKKIDVHGKSDENGVFLTIDNTCEVMPKSSKDGVLISTKHSGAGIGVESAKAIVNRFGGIFETNRKGNMYCVSIMLSADK